MGSWKIKVSGWSKVKSFKCHRVFQYRIETSSHLPLIFNHHIYSLALSTRDFSRQRNQVHSLVI